MRGEWQVNRKNRPATGILARHDFAALRGHEPADDRQAEPEAAGARGVAALEFLEQPLAHCGGQARSPVGHGEEDPGPRQIHAGSKEDGRAGGGV